ncbi:MAG: biotin--[acetyl-CoA-carboxylase] ligase [Deltaproteobacteria bacterium]|nr:biotin--[acetyl-CoA-carboxylase] ligase [Deltaproteobacteria bacterium]
MSDFLRKSCICKDLHSEIVGREIRILQQIDSTNLEATRMARQGAAEGLVILAESQSQGRGRSGRQWFSPPGCNIYLSVILRPAIQPSKAPRLSLLAAVAAAQSCRETFDFLPQIKWPNDLLYKGKKFGGILSEMNTVANRIGFVTLGIGINVNATRSLFPPDLACNTTSIRDIVGQRVSREHFLKSLLAELDHWYRVLLRDGFSPVRDEWIRISALHGQRIRVRNGDSTLTGQALGLEGDGSLILQTVDGTVHRIMSGDIVLEASG